MHDPYIEIRPLLEEIKKDLSPHAVIKELLHRRHGNNPGFLAIPTLPGGSTSELRIDPSGILVVKAICVRGKAGSIVPKVRVYPFDPTSIRYLPRHLEFVLKKYPNQILVSNVVLNVWRQNRDWNPVRWHEMVREEEKGIYHHPIL